MLGYYYYYYYYYGLGYVVAVPETDRPIIISRLHLVDEEDSLMHST
jgi:hypothetical protein